MYIYIRDIKVDTLIKFIKLYIEFFNQLIFQVELMNSILPVGLMRVGLHLERALLFKVLADRVGLPTCLVRGHSGRAWVEVALPVLSSTPRPAYPSHLLQPTHIVDLMSSPGTLHPLGSYQASLYCGYV